MPQMAPYNWLILNLYFILMYLIIMSFLNFMKLFKNKLNLNFTIKKKSFKIMW